MTGMREDLERRRHHQQPRRPATSGSLRERAIDTLTTHRHGKDKGPCAYCADFYGDLFDKIAPLINEVRQPAVFVTDDHEECDRQIRAARSEVVAKAEAVLDEHARSVHPAPYTSERALVERLRAALSTDGGDQK